MGKESSEYIYSHDFNDFEEFSEATRFWDLEFVQLGRGAFTGKLLQAGMDDFQVLHAQFSRPLLQRGTSPNNMQTFAVLGNRSFPPVWRKNEIHRDSIMFFSGKILDVVSRADFDVFSISIRDNLLSRFAQVLGYKKPTTVYNGSDTVVGNPESVSLLREHLYGIADTIEKNPQVVTDHRFTLKYKQELSALLLDAIASSNKASLKAVQRLSDKKFKEIESYINNDNSTSSLMISDLCKIANSSERTLRRAFGERYGISPMKYVKCIQLNRVRKDLKRTNPANTKITDIANKWGFWHMGQFASDYRNFFGELPSETLARGKS